MSNIEQLSDPFTYPCRVKDVVDGDTLDLTVDLGFGITKGIRVRLIGVDTAETYGVSHDSEEYQQGKIHTDWVHEWVSVADDDEPFPFLVRTKKTGKYGRHLAKLQRKEDGEMLNRGLVAAFPEVEVDESD